MNLSSIFVVAFICCETIKMHLSRHAPGHEHQWKGIKKALLLLCIFNLLLVLTPLFVPLSSSFDMAVFLLYLTAGIEFFISNIFLIAPFGIRVNPRAVICAILVHSLSFGLVFVGFCRYYSLHNIQFTYPMMLAVSSLLGVISLLLLYVIWMIRSHLVSVPAYTDFSFWLSDKYTELYLRNKWVYDVAELSCATALQEELERSIKHRFTPLTLTSIEQDCFCSNEEEIVADLDILLRYEVDCSDL